MCSKTLSIVIPIKTSAELNKIIEGVLSLFNILGFVSSVFVFKQPNSLKKLWVKE